MFQNCGPRPTGPMYPKPEQHSGKSSDKYECDIIDNMLYMSGYTCKGTCQMDTTKAVEMLCSCFIELGPIQFTKDCEWEYKGDSCPEVPATAEQYNWECNPFKENCPTGQYGASEPVEEEDVSSKRSRKKFRVPIFDNSYLSELYMGSVSEPTTIKATTEEITSTMETTTSAYIQSATVGTTTTAPLPLMDLTTANHIIMTLPPQKSLPSIIPITLRTVDTATVELDVNNVTMLNDADMAPDYDMEPEAVEDGHVAEDKTDELNALDAKYFHPRGGAINNIVNFFNDPASAEKAFSLPQYLVGLGNMPYRNGKEMQNDFAGPSTYQESQDIAIKHKLIPSKTDEEDHKRQKMLQKKLQNKVRN